MTARTGALLRRGLPSTAGVAAPGDKRFRRPDMRPGSRRRFGWVWRVLRVVLVVAAAGAVGSGGVKLALTSRLLKVSHVVVRGNLRLSTAEIEALIQGIRGQNILMADLDQYRRQLMDSPWVATATVRRVLPGTVEVRVAERTPMAITRMDGRLYLVDDTGVIVDEFGPQYREFDLPVVDGLVRTPQGGAPAVDEARAQLTRRFLDALQPVPAMRQRISQIDASNERDLAVLLADDPTWVHLGDQRFVERLKTYLELAPTLQDRLPRIDYVDMRFDERVFVKSRTAAKVPRATKK